MREGSGEAAAAEGMVIMESVYNELMKRQPSLYLRCWSDNPRYTRELVSRNKQLPLTMICGFSDHIDSYEDHRSWYPYEGVRKDTRSKDIS